MLGPGLLLVTLVCYVAPWLLAGVLILLQSGSVLFLGEETQACRQKLSELRGLGEEIQACRQKLSELRGLGEEIQACRQKLSELNRRVDLFFSTLISKVDNLENMGTKISKIPPALSSAVDEMRTTVQTKISSISCQMDCISGFTSSFWCSTQRLEQLLTGLTQEIRANQSNFEIKVITALEKETRGDRVGDPFSASSGGYSTLVTLLTELRQEIKGSGPDQSKIETKLDLCLAQQMAGFQSQVDQLKQLMSSMGEKIQNLPHLDPHAVSEASFISSAASIGSWTHVTGKPCCYLPDTYFKVVTADGEILSPAKMLFKGAQVVAANGTPVEVVQPPEQHRVEAVIELQADHSFLVVSPDHRILIPGNKTVLGQSWSVLLPTLQSVCMLIYIL